MAVTKDLSARLTSRTITKAGPSPKGAKGVLKYVADTVATAAAADANSIIFFDIKVPVDAVLTSVILRSDDFGATGAVDIGFYPGTLKPNSTGSNIAYTDAKDQDAIGTAIDVNTAALSGSEIRVETLDINKQNKRAFELAGDTTLPAYANYWVWATVQTALASTGDISLQVYYV